MVVEHSPPHNLPVPKGHDLSPMRVDFDPAGPSAAEVAHRDHHVIARRDALLDLAAGILERLPATDELEDTLPSPERPRRSQCHHGFGQMSGSTHWNAASTSPRLKASLI